MRWLKYCKLKTDWSVFPFRCKIYNIIKKSLEKLVQSHFTPHESSKHLTESLSESSLPWTDAFLSEKSDKA